MEFARYESLWLIILVPICWEALYFQAFFCSRLPINMVGKWKFYPTTSRLVNNGSKWHLPRASSLKTQGIWDRFARCKLSSRLQSYRLECSSLCKLGILSKTVLCCRFQYNEWTQVKPLPAPGTEALHTACRKRAIQDSNSSHVECRLIVPRNEDTGMLLKHILAHGTLEDYINPTLIKIMQEGFLKANSHRIQYFNIQRIQCCHSRSSRRRQQARFSRSMDGTKYICQYRTTHLQIAPQGKHSRLFLWQKQRGLVHSPECQ